MTEALLAALFGLLIGSFLNVCIHRWPRGRSVVRPRSHCVRCRKTIPWYDNIPLVSYVILGGKCRYCGRHISARYPAVELITAALFFYFVLRLGLTAGAAKFCVFSAMLVALAFCDLEKRLLPDEFTLGGFLVGVVFALLVPPGSDGDTVAGMFFYLAGWNASARVQSVADSLLAAGMLAGILWVAGVIYLKVRGREGLGLGDVKLVAMIGAFLGFRLALAAMAWGGVAGSVIGLTYIWMAHKDASTFELPYGTFLSAAAVVTAILAV